MMTVGAPGLCCECPRVHHGCLNPELYQGISMPTP